ncbi:EAL domain-containing protein [Iamia majanohamensis]|uniref:EAL domain-containing protein n=1 Tax=Iamia majanohamensis TaxID=467976 RepID=A0AAE9YEE0_9ACTN|nr:bifunctional diguanylate cyclase/phosphodiesterase [Iamia majanohamensis]WCO67127.1 EAL domain-containing protein [Iamia majanohamensis]
MRRHRWRAFLVVGGALSALAALSGSEALIAADIQLVGWSSVVIGLLTVRASSGASRRAWVMFVGAAIAFLSGGIARAVHAGLAGVDRPFPSPADAIVVCGYLLLIAGSVLLGHLRSPDRDRAAIIDGSIVAVGAATVVWTTLLWPHVTDTAIPAPDRALNATYAILTTILLAMITRLAVGPGSRTICYRLLAGSIILIFIQDVLVTIGAVDSQESAAAQLVSPFIFVLFGAAALHPDLPRITEAPARFDVPLTKKRISLLVGALLINPLLVAVQVAMDREPTLEVAATSSVLMSMLVLARLVHLVRRQERATAQEQALRQANADLAVAPDRHAMLQATLAASVRLIGGPGGSARVSVLAHEDDHLAVTASTGWRSREALARRAPLSDTAAWLPAEGPEGSRSVEHEGAPLDVAAHAEEEVWSYVVALSSRRTDGEVLVITTREPLALVVRHALDALATTTGLALESAALSEALQRNRSERRFRALVENSSDLVVVVRTDGHISFVSAASRRLLGREEVSLVGESILLLPHPEDRGLMSDLLAEADSSTFGRPVEVRLHHVDGSPRWFELAARDLHDDPEIEGVVLNCREISDRKDAELRLFRSEARFRALVQNVSDVVAVIDDWGRFTYVSPAITELLGYRPEQLLDTPASAIIAGDQRDSAQETLLEVLRETGGPSPAPSIELTAVALDGTRRTLDVTVSDLRHDPAIHGIVLNARDITVRKQLESTLRHQAHHDALTGLANRTHFTELVEASASDGEANACVLFIDLDDFKTVNDSLGHAVGDELLVAVASRLQAGLPTEATPARLGGDEFAVFVRPTNDDLGPVGVALRLLHDLRTPFDINGWEIVVTASIGIAAVGAEGTTAEVVLRNADMAMYLAKERGKDRVELFEEAMHVSAFERLELKADLARAITSGQLALMYQPVVSLQTGRITGAEALVRWDHPRRGRLAPDAFIGIAEETGLIVQLGQWVLEEACQQLRTWQLTLPPDAALSMSVNLSVRQLEQASIVQSVRDAVDQFGLDPSTLTLEITETVIIDHMETDRSRLTALKELGVQIALDDFGVGYSSLRYVDDLPVDILKVDRSFVGGITDDQPTPVLEAIVALGGRLGVHTTAEGIEHPNQLSALKGIGCDLGQGYWFSPPVAADAFFELLMRNLEHGGFDTSSHDGEDSDNRDSR